MENKLPYPPSWIDRFTRWLDRVPGPAWVYYVIAAIILAVAHALAHWQVGAYPVGTFDAFHVWFMVELVFIVAFVYYLDHYSDGALERFRPALKVSADEYTAVRYQLTHLPARRTLLIGLFVGGLVAVFAATAPDEMLSSLKLAATPTLRLINIGLFGLSWFLTGTLYYHALHQLRLISRIYAEHAEINLLHLTPLYMFSGVTARTAIGITIINAMWTITEPQTLSANLIGAVPYLILALIIFAWPLWGIHRRIQLEKQRALDANGQRWQSIMAALHRDVDSSTFDNSGKYRDFLSSLDLERGVLKKIPTWPWEPETLRGFLSALALPIVIFLIQYVLRLALEGK